MAAQALEDARRGAAGLLLPVFFIVFLVIIVVDEVAIFSGLAFIFSSSSSSESSAMRFRWTGCVCEIFEFGFRTRDNQDLAFFDFVFVDIDFGGTFRATDHAPPSVLVVCKVGVRGPYPPLCSVYIYRGVRSQLPVRGARTLKAIASWVEGPFE